MGCITLVNHWPFWVCCVTTLPALHGVVYRTSILVHNIRVLWTRDNSGLPLSPFMMPLPCQHHSQMSEGNFRRALYCSIWSWRHPVLILRLLWRLRLLNMCVRLVAVAVLRWVRLWWHHKSLQNLSGSNLASADIGRFTCLPYPNLED